MSLELQFTIPGQAPQVVALSQARSLVGTLLSNHVVLRAPGVEPIHAMFEEADDGSERWVITDLGSVGGVKVNGKKIDVECPVNAGDVIEIGSVSMKIGLAVEADVAAGDVAAASTMAAAAGRRVAVGGMGATVDGRSAEKGASRTVRHEETRIEKRHDEKKDVLFSPREAKPTGDVLEVVAYWGDTVLEVEHFSPRIKGYERVTIGDPTKAHFIAAGKEHLSRYELAKVGADGYEIKTLAGMKARLRKGGKVEKSEDAHRISLGRRDIAHIKYGAVRYFFLFVRPPELVLPRMGPRDPIFMGLTSFALLIYFLLIPFIWMTNPGPKPEDKDDVWSIVHVPEKQRPPDKPVPEKKPPVPKPQVKVAEVKKTPPPPKVPPPPKPKPVEPAKPVEAEKPKQMKPVEKPVEKPVKSETSLANNHNNANKADKHEVAKSKSQLNKLSNALSKGMPSTGAKNPDFKMAGPKTNDRLGRSGGPKGSGMKQLGGAIKGNQKASVHGVEDAHNNKPSGPNLSKLGVGVGLVLSKTGPGAIASNFRSSAGGAGGGMGSGAKTYGLGGLGNGHSLGLAGAGSAIGNFGSGSGGLLSGQGGTGGLGGAGLGRGLGAGGGGRPRANVEVPPGDPVVSGGLTAQEILAVIRANLNQIRHCYEQLLQRSPSSSGKLEVQFIVGVDGHVTTVSVTDATISDSMMRSCVTGRIRRWDFPRPRGGQAVTVNYPFVFNPL